jgi:hypothetical protein
MYPHLLNTHSILRWLVVAGLLIPLLGAYAALVRPRSFSQADSAGIRWGTTAAHTQLMVGMALYVYSPFVKLFWSEPAESVANRQLLFFGIIHIMGMIFSVVLMTIGSSMARRADDDRTKFRAIAIYWTIALLVIALLIPWPFSPLAQRPVWRPF